MKKLPAGEYYVGDPCYCFEGSCSAVLAATDFFKNETVSFNGGFVAATNTAYGDGRYDGSDGNSYPVDAGLIGAVSVNLYEGTGDSPFGMIRKVFKEEFTVSKEDGTITIGDVEIYTS